MKPLKVIFEEEKVETIHVDDIDLSTHVVEIKNFQGILVWDGGYRFVYPSGGYGNGIAVVNTYRSIAEVIDFQENVNVWRKEDLKPS